MKTILIALVVALSLVGCKSTGELRAERAEAKQTQANADAVAKKQRELAEDSALKKAMEKPESPAAIALVIGHYMARQSESFATALKAAEVEPLIEGWDDKLLRFGLGTISALAPVAGNVILGLDAGKTNRRASDNALAAAANEALQRTQQLGVVRDTATGTANTLSPAIAAGIAKPSNVFNVTNGSGQSAIVVNGGNATNSKECVTGGTAPGGNSTGGATGNGGNGATATASGGSATAGSGAPSGAAAPTGAGGQSGPTGSNGC